MDLLEARSVEWNSSQCFPRQRNSQNSLHFATRPRLETGPPGPAPTARPLQPLGVSPSAPRVRGPGWLGLHGRREFARTDRQCWGTGLVLCTAEAGSSLAAPAPGPPHGTGLSGPAVTASRQRKWKGPRVPAGRRCVAYPGGTWLPVPNQRSVSDHAACLESRAPRAMCPDRGQRHSLPPRHECGDQAPGCRPTRARDPRPGRRRAQLVRNKGAQTLCSLSCDQSWVHPSDPTLPTSPLKGPSPSTAASAGLGDRAAMCDPGDGIQRGRPRVMVPSAPTGCLFKNCIHLIRVSI